MFQHLQRSAALRRESNGKWCEAHIRVCLTKNLQTLLTPDQLFCYFSCSCGTTSADNNHGGCTCSHIFPILNASIFVYALFSVCTELFGFGFGLLRRISGSRLPNEGVTTDSAVDGASDIVDLCLLCLCVSGRAQHFLCFMGLLLLWSTITSTTLL